VLVTRIGTRVGQLILVLLAVSVITFAVQSAAPQDRAEARVGQRTDLRPEQREELVTEIRHQLGLDRPLPVQYAIWLWDAGHFDFGTSDNGVPVRKTVVERLAPSVELAIASAVIAVPVALGLALLASRYRRRAWTRAVDVAVVTGLALPPFWVGILLVLLLAVVVPLLPASGYVSFSSDPSGHVARLVLPAVTLALPQIGIYYRYLQEALEVALRSQFVRTARAKGLSEWATLIRHALPNAILPMMTIFGVYLGSLMGGIVVVENVFGWPGVGSLLLYAVGRSDYDVTVAIVLAAATFFVVISALVDLAHLVVDPRIRRA
jgi:peptide/nickel transport system permease protein